MGMLKKNIILKLIKELVLGKFYFNFLFVIIFIIIILINTVHFVVLLKLI